MQAKPKEDKQKVTLYLPPALHRQLKIRAAVDSETMTDIAERAIYFYLSHPEVVERYEDAYGQTHRVYSCPSCQTQSVIREGEMVALGEEAKVVMEEGLSKASAVNSMNADSQGEGELVPC